MDNINDNNVNNKGEYSDYFGMNGNSNEDLNNETIKDVNYEEVNNSNTIYNGDSNNNNINKEKKYKNVESKNRKGGKIAALIAGALVCAMLGGTIGGAGVYYLTKNNNSSLGGSKKSISYDPPTFTSATSKDGVLSATEAVKRISPAVVGVAVKSISRNSFLDIKEQDGIGSGFIINEEGYVVTNYHVINGASEVKIILNDGKEVNAKVINYDADQDIAVVKITDKMKVPGVAVLGNSDALQAGEDVIAMGNPLGKEFSQTVTKGVVSSADRVIKTEKGVDTHYIQTDTAINPGNSGGPLINAKGEVIGINSAKKVGEGIEGIGFSIPINKVRERLDVLSKPILKLGIVIRDIDDKTAKANGLEEGVYVREIEEFSAAEKAGLKIGDLIVKVDGKRIKTSKELNDLKNKHKEGEVVNLAVIRDNKEVNIQIKLQS